MRIPLDYYRILGLPIQASHEQLQQAYSDRTVQLPRREYSGAAITARKQLLEEAYAVLSDPEQRSRYDASYLAHIYEWEAAQPSEPKTEKSPELLPNAVALHTPNIKISDEQFVGALLILQELGEYELVLKLGGPYLSSSSVSLENGSRSEANQVQSDIVLTVTLAYLELGREQWQQGQYENAAISLETGDEILLDEGIFPSLRGEIQADLYKLRPYRIIELLARPEENVAERRLGLQLLEKLLQERGGIDGNGDDWSGLGLDDFLRFIQQLRSYLTAAEQQSLFEAESLRPSGVATYLAVYALLARGFAQRLPVLIARAKLLLMRLGKHQDLHLEQAVCSLLLGQTEEASRALELSHEHEPLEFIQEYSQGSPDLLPGLCLYSEHWLQTEVFPHFRDLAHEPASLKDYFADEQVQVYLEALPNDPEETLMAPQSLAYSQAIASHQSSDSAKVSKSLGEAATSLRTATTTVNATPNGVPIVPDEQRINLPDSPPDATILAKSYQPKRSRRRTRSRFASSEGALHGKTLSPRRGRSSTSAVGNVLKAKGTRLALLLVGGVLGVVVLGFLLSRTYGWVRQTFFPAPSLQTQQPLELPPPKIPVNQPPLPLPTPTPIPSSKPPVQSILLTQKTAEKVIQTWLSTKAAAFGSDHAVDRLKQILVEPALSQWQELAQKNKADDLYRQYKHILKVESVKTSQANPNQAQVEATINEVAQLYEDGQLNQGSSYNENLRVRYNLVRQDGQWRINEMTILK